MFFEPQRTAYDLNWRMFGIPVRVHPFFWLFTAIMGWDYVQLGWQFLLLWIGCVFVSILIHEMGHIIAGRIFGAHGHIVLYSFGGLAIGSNALPSRWQRIGVSVAGPLAGFLFFGLIWAASRHIDQKRASLLLLLGLDNLVWINLAWNIVNLLPIWPLDGGQISRELFEWRVSYRGARLAYVLSAILAGLLAVNALLVTQGHPIKALDRVPYLNQMSGMYIVLLFAFLAFNSYQMVQYESSRQPWDTGGDWWKG